MCGLTVGYWVWVLSLLPRGGPENAMCSLPRSRYRLLSKGVIHFFCKGLSCYGFTACRRFNCKPRHTSGFLLPAPLFQADASGAVGGSVGAKSRGSGAEGSEGEHAARRQSGVSFMRATGQSLFRSLELSRTLIGGARWGQPKPPAFSCAGVLLVCS